jgi:hypothetical protein
MVRFHASCIFERESVSLRKQIGVAAAVIAVVCAFLAVVFAYTLMARRMSTMGKLEGVLFFLLFSILAYLLVRFIPYAFGKQHDLAWQKADAYKLLLFGLIAYGGSIPWVIYLTLVKDHDLIWLPLIACPFYAYLVWAIVKMFRYKMKEINKNGRDK